MKKLFISMMACLLVASTSYAFESTITGSYAVRGQMLSYDEADRDDSYYDQDLDINVQINTDENTFLKFAIEARDASMMDTRDIDGTRPVTVDANGNNIVNDGNTEFDVMSVWLTHKFGTGTTLEVGDMADPLFFGSGMATYEFDDGIEGFALKLTQDIAMGSVYFLTEKLDERKGDIVAGKTVDNSVFDGDVDAYALGAVLNFDGITVEPRIAYVTDQADNANDDVLMVNLYTTGTFGKLSVALDLAYLDVEDGNDDFGLFGALLDVDFDMDFMTVGGFAVYAGQDDDNGNEELFPVYDWNPLYAWGDYVEGRWEHEGVTLFGLKAKMPVNDQLTINGVIAYGLSNSDVSAKEYDGFEVDLGASYKITDALTYNVELAYATFDGDSNAAYDEDVLLMANKLTLSF